MNYALEMQLKAQHEAQAARGRAAREDKDPVGFYGQEEAAHAAPPAVSGISFEQAVELAKANGLSVVCPSQGTWSLCKGDGVCQIRRAMLDPDDSREYWA